MTDTAIEAQPHIETQNGLAHQAEDRCQRLVSKAASVCCTTYTGSNHA